MGLNWMIADKQAQDLRVDWRLHACGHMLSLCHVRRSRARKMATPGASSQEAIRRNKSSTRISAGPVQCSRAYADTPPGREVRYPDAREEAGVHCDRHIVAGVGDRREHRDLHADQHDS